MNRYGNYESEGKFLGEEYPDTYGLRRRKGGNVEGNVEKVALNRIGSNGSLQSVALDDDEFNRAFESKRNCCSKAYRLFASYFTSCKEAVFGRPGLNQAIKDLDEVFVEDQYVYGNHQPVRSYNDCDFDIRAAELTFYEKISKWVYSVYESVVDFFYDLFGIDD